MQVQPYFHFIPKPTAAEIWPQSQTGPSGNTKAAVDVCWKPNQPKKLRASFSSCHCSGAITASPTSHPPHQASACPCTQLPGTQVIFRVIFPWKCLAWIPLPGESFCSPLRKYCLSHLWTPQWWHLPTAFSFLVWKAQFPYSLPVCTTTMMVPGWHQTC